MKNILDHYKTTWARQKEITKFKELIFLPTRSHFLFGKSSNWQRVQVKEKILGIVNFYSFETRHFKKGWRAQREVEQWTNSEERECGNKFGRGRNLLRPLGANPIYSASKGGNMKTLSVSLNSNLAWGSGAPTQKSNSLFSWFWLADWPNTWLWLALIGDQMHRQEGNMKTLQVRDTMIVMTWVLGFSSPIKIEMILVDVVIRPKLLR